MMQRLLLVILTVGYSTALVAQDGSELSTKRTPDQARQFLAELPAKVELSAVSYGNNKSRISSNISTIRAEGACTSVFDGPPRSYIIRDANWSMKTAGPFAEGRPGLFVPFAQEIIGLGMVEPPYRVEWGKTSPIIQSPPSVIDGTPMGNLILQVQTNLLQITLFFPNGEIASRAKLAMETVRAACDPVADTGF